RNHGAPELITHFDDIHPEEDRLLIEHVVQHIKKHIASIESINDLACQVGCCEKEINRVFTSHLGQTVFSYMRIYRMDKAKSMLARTRMPIAKLALEVGYPNSSNFSTAFKSIVGISPMQYRAQALAAAAAAA